MILVLSTMHISQMVFKRKKSYKPKSGEREGGQDYMSRFYMHWLREHDEVTLGHK